MMIEVWGKYACFTRPEFSSERVTYDVMTPSAAKGLLESIYWHPGLEYVVDKIYVLNPIKHTNLTRNEITKTVSAKVKDKPLNADILGDDPNSVQRFTKALKDVHYVIRFHIETDKTKMSETDSEMKFISMSSRRTKKGQCWKTPFLGCREFAAKFREWPEDKHIFTINETEDLGLMLHSFDYSEPDKPLPVFFKAEMKHGVIDCSGAQKYALVR